MRTSTLFLLLLISAVVRSPEEIRAQSVADSVGIMQAVGRSLQDEPITAVADRLACYHAPTCSAAELSSPSAVQLLQVLSTTADVPLVSPLPPGSVPSCPPPERTDSENPGYLLHVGVPQIQGDRAVLAVARACEWSPTARDPTVMLGEEYVLERMEGAWAVVARRFTWIS
jgi:hypothetical protein